MLHNLKNLPRRQIHLLKRSKRENTLMISLISLKCWMYGSAVPVGLRGFTSDAEEANIIQPSALECKLASSQQFHDPKARVTQNHRITE